MPAAPRRLLLGVLLLMGALPLSAQPLPQPHDVVVNEIMYAPSPAQNEFVELYNRSDRTFDLRDLAFSDDREMPNAITDDARLLAPGEYVVLVRDAALFEAAFPGVPYVVPVGGWDALNNGGDAVVLYAGGTEIDRVPYAPDWGGTDGRSLERIDPAGPSDRAVNFRTSTAPSDATPGTANSIFAPDDAPPGLVFAEVVAPDTVAAHFDEPVDPAPDAAAFRLDDGRTPASARVAHDGTRVDLAFADAVTGRRLHVDGVRDLVGNVLRDASLDLAYPAGEGDLALNEIMYDPLADDFDDRPNQPEYFEIVNRADRAVSLRGLFWTDRPDETGTADTTRVSEDVLRALPPEGFAVVYAEPEDAVDDPARESTLARAFPEVDLRAPEVVLLPIAATRLGLRNDGDLIRLHRVDGTRTAEVAYEPDWHAPSVVEPKGVALERISLTTSSGSATNWTSSVAPGGGTPGRPNAVRLGTEAPTDHTLTIHPSPFSPDGDGHDDVTRIRYRLDADVALVRARIYDALGRPVRTLEDARLVSRTGELLWDGRGDDGQRLRIGIYVVLFEALDAQGGAVITLKRPVVLARALE